MTTPTQTLTTLHALHTEWVAAGLPEVWPEMVTLDTESNPEAIPLYGYNSGMPWAIMDPPDALAIVERRWWEGIQKRSKISLLGVMNFYHNDLPAAIRAEIGRKMEETR